jgi:hypothetical protein
MNKPLLALFASAFFAGNVQATSEDKFRQLEEILPTPNTYRTASGAPGHQYWQQQADYQIKVNLDEQSHRLSASAKVRYQNNSPDQLSYLWLQLDQNIYQPNSAAVLAETGPTEEKVTYDEFRTITQSPIWQGGFQIKALTIAGKPAKYSISGTMLRIDLPKALASGDDVEFQIEWNYQITEQKVLGGRSGYEYFKEDNNYLYEIAQWFPRMAAYYDVYGWQNKQFLGDGEFTLEFGNYEVAITVPADHIVAATGELQNADDVLSTTEQKRLATAAKSDKPVLIVTEAEAIANEKAGTNERKTWHYKAKNVRDFAFASSRKFIWDAQHVKSGDRDVLAMSYYPKDGNPLWQQYSTQAVVHTIESYNKYSIEYPYPVAISVNGPVGGMEYPMISFNGARPEKDKKTGEKTYSRMTKYGLISVIIHEVGHNYYPMIINSDERQWTWMDEGLNTFVQYLAEQSWEENYPSRRGEARDIVDYMRSDHQVPIMTNSESVLQFGNNAYGKPATALNILRETIMGRELFDFAFKTYAERWQFKRPTPADFFRTMEDASAVDLDWFWRGWFYTTDPVDISLDKVTLVHIDSKNPQTEKAWEQSQEQAEPESISAQRNKTLPKRLDSQPELKDFYNEHSKFAVTNADKNEYQSTTQKLEDYEKALLNHDKLAYQLEFSNVGGLVMPIILELKFKDGSTKELRIPAEIWRKNSKNVSKLLILDQELIAVELDPHWETADIDINNNSWPRKVAHSKLELYKRKKGENQMKDFNEKLKPAIDDKAAADKPDQQP